MSGAEAPRASSQSHVIIGGFGLPGRCAAELLRAQEIPFCVIDLNPATAARCGSNGPHFIIGDMRSETVLEQAGIHRARLIAITVPDDNVALEVVQVARRVRPDVPLLTRCTYTSIGLKARQLGVSGVIVAEQLVANEFRRLIEISLCSPPPAAR